MPIFTVLGAAVLAGAIMLAQAPVATNVGYGYASGEPLWRMRA